jgi:hypothetical protein
VVQSSFFAGRRRKPVAGLTGEKGTLNHPTPTVSPLTCNMKTDVSTSENITTAASVAPEDLKCGDFVAILNEVIEVPSYLWVNSVTIERDTVVRVRLIPSGSGTPLKVKAICLPFVFVKPPTGEFETIDIRRVQLVRLNEAYGRSVRKGLRQKNATTESQDIGR